MRFEDRAVAFIDVLGFKALVAEATENEEKLNALSGLIDLLESAVPILDSSVDSCVPTELIPKHIYISDCIILSAPVRSACRPSYNGLSTVVMRAIQLSHYFLNNGYLIRGGIAVGKTWHTGFNIVGPAYQEAYLLEHCGNEPIIVLSEGAAMMWQGGSRMCLKNEGKVFVNGLFECYIPNNCTHGGIERAYDLYHACIDKNIKSDLPCSARQKWSWFNEFLESERSEQSKWVQA